MCTSPFLVREARLVALSRALRGLTLDTLDLPAHRAGAYARAALDDVAPEEDAEARRRRRLYWRHMRPGSRPERAPPRRAGVRPDFAATGPRHFPARRGDADLPPLRLVPA